MNTPIPIITIHVPDETDSTRPTHPLRTARAGGRSRYEQFEGIIRLLLLTRTHWAELIARLHDEHQMDFHIIASLIGEPTAHVRRHYHRAKACPSESVLGVN